MRILISVFFLLCFAPPNARAQTPSFQFPAACVRNENCWVVNYVDVNPQKNVARDFHCGHRTYDDHNGTDIGVADMQTMRTGIDVLAAAPGTVLRVREGQEDKTVTAEERLQMLEGNKGCGNGVFIDHGAGWQTIYCHMKKGSITVRPNQTVRAGQKLGQIGSSGIAEFPHLHFGVFFEGSTIDPFTGLDDRKPCNTPPNAPLWDAALAFNYEPVSIYAAGFTTAAPDFEAIKTDGRSPASLPLSSDALVFWVAMFGAAKNDLIHIDIADPLGRVFVKRTITQDKDRARQFYYSGRKTAGAPLIPGTYTGNVRLERTLDNGHTISSTASRMLAIE